MKRVRSSLRWVEASLWIVGLALLAFASGATLARWQYQSQQERALFGTAPSESNANAPAGAPPGEPAFVAGKSSDPLPTAGFRKPPARAVFARSPIPTRGSAAPAAAGADPAAVGRLEIPRIGLAAIVRDGDDEGTLRRAVGRVPGSARPGEEGNIILAAHRDTFFWPLKDIQVNDRIRIRRREGLYEYRVSSLKVVSPEQTDVLAAHGGEELTLVTCYPFRFIGPAPERFIVSATRVN